MFQNDTLVDRYVGGVLEIRYLLTVRARVAVSHSIADELKPRVCRQKIWAPFESGQDNA